MAILRDPIFIRFPYHLIVSLESALEGIFGQYVCKGLLQRRRRCYRRLFYLAGFGLLQQTRENKIHFPSL